ncbi:DEAD/DEAH box helicase [Candidatus Amesbacteria bacterium]|nr:DEAD/DEAH box helicase [Candidatus Amesbacteria bacterium]
MFRRSTRIRSYKPNNSAGIRSPFGGRTKTSKISPTKYVNRTQAQAQETEVKHEIKNQFIDFNIDIRIKENVRIHGYLTPTPIQDQVIPFALEGRDVVGIANTGTGKTAAFLIPIVNKILLDVSQKALIVAPTRELAFQISDELKIFAKNLPIRSVLVMGGAGMYEQVKRLQSRPNIVIATVGRLKDLVGRRAINLSEYKTVVMDEVDRMVDIGFIKDIRYLISLLPSVRQSLFFSATVSPEINMIIRSFAPNPVTISVKTTETAQNVDQDIIKVSSKEEKIAKLFELLKQGEFRKVMVFGRTKWNVEKLANTLLSAGFNAASIHGNKTQGQRLKALSMFKTNQVQVLVATDVAARGLDIDDVSHVINFDEPEDYTAYVHRIGRTGRANKMGKALTFVI